MRSLLLCFLLPLTLQSQVVNSSFEEWYTDSIGIKRLVGWQHVQKQNIPGQLIGTSRDSGSQHLDYAIRISRWYDYTWDKILQKSAIGFNPSSLTGYYKYTGNDLTGDRTKDTAYIHILLTRWNAPAGQADTIGEGYIELGAATSYRFFECNIQYRMPGQADSIFLDISPSKWLDVPSYCATPGYCSFFTLDNLSLKTASGSPQVNVAYPNPARTTVSINLPTGEKGMANIMNVLGQRIVQQPVSGGVNTFSISLLSTGVYFLQVVTTEGKTSVFKILKH